MSTLDATRTAGPATRPRSITPVTAPGYDVQTHARQFAAGRQHDALPWGLERLPAGWTVAPLASTAPERWVPRRRRQLAAFVGFDLLGAVVRARRMRRSDVIYGHVEGDVLGAALALLLTRARRPFLVGQTCWLFASIDAQPRWWQRMILALYGRVDLLVHNARPNLEKARTLLPAARHVFVPFGVSPTFAATPWAPASGRPTVLTVGHDRARDWVTLGEALRPLHEQGACHVRVACRDDVPDMAWAEVRGTETFDELLGLYRTAGCVVIATQPTNLHASGITTILEAASVGVPVVATRCGGLSDYFAEDEVCFVDAGDAAALRAATARLLNDPDEAARRSAALQRRCRESRYDNGAYWARIVAEVQGVTADAGVAAR